MCKILGCSSLQLNHRIFSPRAKDRRTFRAQEGHPKDADSQCWVLFSLPPCRSSGARFMLKWVKILEALTNVPQTSPNY